MNDGTTDSNVATVTITVRPVNDPPACAAARIETTSLWPPDHKMMGATILGITDVEGDAVTLSATAVFQDEPTNGQGDGDTSPDAVLSPLHLRWERSGQGNGRVYHVRFRAVDAGAASCTGELTICVPHNPGDTCVAEGPLYDSTR